MKFVLLFLIRFYQAVHGSFFYGTCRFHPTCSHYASEAVEAHGALRGSLLAVQRILRCQPFCRGGYDPIPSLEEFRKIQSIEKIEKTTAPFVRFVPTLRRFV